MKIKIRQFQQTIRKPLIYVYLIPMILMGKLVRYTIMKETLVDTSIGHFMLEIINEGNLKLSTLITDITVDATRNAAAVMQVFGFFGLNTYVEYEIAISIVWNFLLVMMLKKVNNRLTIYQITLILLSIIVLNIFDFNLAKEPIQMLYFVLIFFICVTDKFSIKTKYILSLGTIILSILTYRIYYILVLFFCLEIMVLLNLFIYKNMKFNKITILGIIIIIVFSYFILLNICKAIQPAMLNELIRVRTRSSSAVSDISNILHSRNLFVFSLDYFFVLIRIMFPIELMSLGPKYFAYVIYQLTVSVGVFQTLKKVKGNSDVINLALCIYIGFWFASGAFEPDFGSWIRHEAVVFPILLLMFNCTKEDMI